MASLGSMASLFPMASLHNGEGYFKVKSISTVWQGLVADNFMDWIKDKQSRIACLVLLVIH